MGYIKHHAIIVSSWNDEKIIEAHKEALETFDKCQVTNVIVSPINGFKSFMIGPDGSSEHWSESEDYDQRRFNYICWMQNNSYEDGSSMIAWAEVVFKDEKSIPHITQYN